MITIDSVICFLGFIWLEVFVGYYKFVYDHCEYFLSRLYLVIMPNTMLVIFWMMAFLLTNVYVFLIAIGFTEVRIRGSSKYGLQISSH